MQKVKNPRIFFNKKNQYKYVLKERKNVYRNEDVDARIRISGIYFINNTMKSRP